MRSKTVIPIILVTFFSVAPLSGCALLSFHSLNGDIGDSDPSQAKALSSSPTSGDENGSELLEAQRLDQARHTGQITVGMDMQDVQSIWGQPSDVETAGNPALGNQKWVYFDGLSARWSLSTAREIYFESGKVVGWRTLANR